MNHKSLGRRSLYITTSLFLCWPLAEASAQSLTDYAGVWQRTGGQEDPPVGNYRLSVSGARLQGSMTNPPEGYQCQVSLELSGGKLEGTAKWLDPFGKELVTSWSFTPQSRDVLDGRCEWKVWEGDGSVSDEGMGNYRLIRVKRVGLVTQGEAEEPFGDPLPGDLSVLAGGWEGPGGPWKVMVSGGSLTFEPVGHSEGVEVTLQNERGTLRGGARLPGEDDLAEVELAYDDGAGTLAGRGSWREGMGDDAESGWSPLEFRRLERFDAGPPDEGRLERGESGSLVGVYKRDDGLYLRVRETGRELEGDLVDREGRIKCRLRLQERSGVFAGTANWEGVEASWELVITADGLRGRCEWIDQAGGRTIAKGWSTRTFVRLQRVN